MTQQRVCGHSSGKEAPCRRQSNRKAPPPLRRQGFSVGPEAAGLEIKEHTAGNAEAIRIARHGDLQLGKGIDAVVHIKLSAAYQVQAEVCAAEVDLRDSDLSPRPACNAQQRVMPSPAPA